MSLEVHVATTTVTVTEAQEAPEVLVVGEAPEVPMVGDAKSNGTNSAMV